MTVNDISPGGRRFSHSDSGYASTNALHPDQSSQRLIEFAVIWAPYGGASSEDVLVNFGMTVERFVERLWRLVADIDCAPETLDLLASTYPRSSKL